MTRVRPRCGTGRCQLPTAGAAAGHQPTAFAVGSAPSRRCPGGSGRVAAPCQTTGRVVDDLCTKPASRRPWAIPLAEDVGSSGAGDSVPAFSTPRCPVSGPVSPAAMLPDGACQPLGSWDLPADAIAVHPTSKTVPRSDRSDRTWIRIDCCVPASFTRFRPRCGTGGCQRPAWPLAGKGLLLPSVPAPGHSCPPTALAVAAARRTAGRGVGDWIEPAWHLLVGRK